MQTCVLDWDTLLCRYFWPLCFHCEHSCSFLSNVSRSYSEFQSLCLGVDTGEDNWMFSWFSMQWLQIRSSHFCSHQGLCKRKVVFNSALLEGVWRRKGIAPRSVNLGNGWRWANYLTPRRLYVKGQSPWQPLCRGSGGGEGYVTDCNAVVCKKSLASRGVEPRFLCPPVPSVVTILIGLFHPARPTKSVLRKWRHKVLTISYFW